MMHPAITLEDQLRYLNLDYIRQNYDPLAKQAAQKS